MAIITSLPNRPKRSFRFYLFVGLAIGACSSFVVRWTLRANDGYSSALLALPDHINYFPHGEKGYLAEHYCIDNSHTKECCSQYQCTMFVNRSTLYSECCDHVHNDDHTTISTQGRQRSKLLPLLITSAPRSGTRFIQQLFTRVGLNGLTTDVHSPQNRGTVSWKHIFDDDHYLSGDTTTHLYQSKFRVIWHLVRDPLKSLTSLAFTEPLLEDSLESERYLNYISKHVHVSNQTTLRNFFHISPEDWEGRINGTANEKIDKFRIYRGLEIYLHWHGFINYLNVPIFRLEDLSVKKNVSVLDEVFYSVGMTPPRHVLVNAFLEAQEEKKNEWNTRRRLSEARQLRKYNIQNGGVKMQLHKNEREHRPTLSWREVCHVNKRKARELLKMSQSFGYYQELNEESLCPE